MSHNLTNKNHDYDHCWKSECKHQQSGFLRPALYPSKGKEKQWVFKKKQKLKQFAFTWNRWKTKVKESASKRGILIQASIYTNETHQTVHSNEIFIFMSSWSNTEIIFFKAMLATLFWVLIASRISNTNNKYCKSERERIKTLCYKIPVLFITGIRSDFKMDLD